MQSALVSAPLASTPPQHTPTRNRRASNGVFSFRTSEDVNPGSLSRGTSSVLESGSWRSLSSTPANSVQPLTSSKSIPKSTTFVKVEGFCTSTDSLDSLPNSVPHSPNFKTASSLLSRQLSEENLNVLHRPIPTTTYASALAQQLEAQCNQNQSASSSMDAISLVEPKARPASLPRRPSIPDNLLQQLQSRHRIFHEHLVVRAFNISRLAHDGRYDGPNGEPAFSRCVGAATVLAELGADEVAVAGALLHDALDRTMLLEGQLRPMLGNDETLDLVKKVSHLGYVCHKHRSAINTNGTSSNDTTSSAVASHLVSLLVAHGPPRALLVRLAVALHEARASDSKTAVVSQAASASRIAERRRSAIEGVNVWAPLANRLGVWSVKAELEDRAFRALHPGEYAELRERLERVQEPTQLVALVDKLRCSLQDAGVDYLDLSGRPKHLWGVWKKMQTKGYSADKVKDVRGLRIIVKTREDCYKALRAVEKAWSVAGPAKNYIKDPKANGYQSLHVIADPGDGHRVEIQIRTDKMHYLAEYGADASHWKYKENKAGGMEGAANGDGAGDAREATWAKFVTSQYVAKDKKCRPSGSPSEDHSLSSILAMTANNSVVAAAAETETGISPGSTKNGKSFHEYIVASGQNPAPPSEQRALVAVVAGGAFSVAELQPKTSLGTLLASCGVDVLCPPAPRRSVHVLVNRQVESDLSAVLMAGDVVELYLEETSISADPLPTIHEKSIVEVAKGSPRSNMMPLGSLSKKLASVTL